MVGAMYCKKPITDKGIVFAALEYQNNGVAVAAPTPTNKINVLLGTFPITPIPFTSLNKMNNKANGANKEVSRVRPRTASTLASFLNNP